MAVLKVTEATLFSNYTASPLVWWQFFSF
jgi:hypothetical protein